MEIKKLLEAISHYTLVHNSLLKRLFPDEFLRDIRETILLAQEHKLILIHDFPNFRCYSLSSKGFEAIDIKHQPHIQFTSEQADSICRTNHIQLGFKQSFDFTDKLKLHKWVSGGKFQKSPFFIRVNKIEQKLQPLAAGILVDSAPLYKVFSIHMFSDLETLHRDMFLYQLLEQRALHIKRWFLPKDTPLRIIVLVDSYKTIHSIRKHLKSQFYRQVLFLPVTQVHVNQLLQQSVFLDCKGVKRGVVSC
jgi:hypothetical protein